MKAYVYGARRDLPQGFEDFTTAARSAIVSIDMHQGHLADTPECPCPAPRAREIVAPIDAFHAAARMVGARPGWHGAGVSEPSERPEELWSPTAESIRQTRIAATSHDHQDVNPLPPRRFLPSSLQPPPS